MHAAACVGVSCLIHCASEHLHEESKGHHTGDCGTGAGRLQVGLRTAGAGCGFHPLNMCLQVDAFFSYYPKRLGQVLFVDAPWGFNAGWSVVKPWLQKYAALVTFVSREELRKQYFTPQTVPDDFRK